MYIHFFKRGIDIVVTVILFIGLSPLWITLVGSLLFSGSDVFYRQPRIGYQRRYFYIWKFATMHRDSPKMQGGYFTTRNDPRVSRVGRWLRKTKLNELPQLINVLRGDMSLVGPRPLVDETFLAYSESAQQIIIRLKPGITGVGSIIFRDEEHLLSASDVAPKVFYFQHIAPYKAALEIWYADHVSLWNDLKILFLTLWVVVFPKSDLAFKMLKNLPPKPEVLTGISF